MKIGVGKWPSDVTLELTCAIQATPPQCSKLTEHPPNALHGLALSVQSSFSANQGYPNFLKTAVL